MPEMQSNKYFPYFLPFTHNTHMKNERKFHTLLYMSGINIALSKYEQHFITYSMDSPIFWTAEATSFSHLWLMNMSIS